MNVFEDLVVELQAEDLLETVVDLSPEAEEVDFGKPALGEEAGFLRREAELRKSERILKDEKRPASHVKAEAVRQPLAAVVPAKAAKQSHGNKDFPKMAAAHQLVEHVVTSIERQHLKIIPASFDDLRVRKALHDLANAAPDPASQAFTTAERLLSAELDSWRRALMLRDKGISAGNLRRYCETCQPALSSQALFSLARFYYELPPTELSRSKFDFVITKLFSRPVDGAAERQLVCQRSEIAEHLRSRFAEWSCASTVDPRDPRIFADLATCAAFVAEAENAERLDEMLGTDFFNRIRVFKENTGELFFTPGLAAAVIDCNIRVGNRFVKLVRAEAKPADADDFLGRFGSAASDTFEVAASRTFDFVELLNLTFAKRKLARAQRSDNRSRDKSHNSSADTKDALPRQKPDSVEGVQESSPVRAESAGRFSGLFAVNKWLAVGGLIVIALSVGMYVWSERLVAEEPLSGNVKVVEIDDPSLKEYVKTARLSSETFYGVTQPAWDNLSKEKQEEVLSKILQSGREKGFVKVNLINGNGKPVGFASSQRIEVAAP